MSLQEGPVRRFIRERRERLRGSPQEKPCPVKGCPTKWRTEDGLFGHLHKYHSRTELIECIVELLKHIPD